MKSTEEYLKEAQEHVDEYYSENPPGVPGSNLFTIFFDLICFIPYIIGAIIFGIIWGLIGTKNNSN